MVSGAQAADMPVKAKPVEYVKICSAYGAGFYYIPGTDICLRVGGYVYYEFGVKGTSAIANIYESLGGGNPIDHDYNYYNSRTSAKVILDARQNTAYGTLRATFSLGPTNANHSTAAGLDYAYIQFAGFTWGYTNSFFSMGGAYSIVANPALDWSWINVFAYTAQLGNGVTASISFEDPEGRRANNSPYGGRWSPEIVGNFNVTQAWGRAQIMGALHQIKTAAGSPNESDWGWAVGAGIEVKTPQTGNPNNSFLLQGTITEGATDYTGYNSSPTAAAAGTTFALQNWAGTGPVYAVNDFFINAAGGVELVEAWSVYAAYRHYWTPMLRTGFFAGWLNIDEGSDANSQGELDVLQAGISTIWSPVAGLDLSLDLVYSDLERTSVAGVTTSNDIWTVWSRLRRNF
ncbi:MAG TPA: porin [Xanthobacteraceae bacterium]|nr:porin [Xanthobacteraceae bacterium]